MYSQLSFLDLPKVLLKPLSQTLSILFCINENDLFISII